MRHELNLENFPRTQQLWHPGIPFPTRAGEVAARGRNEGGGSLARPVGGLEPELCRLFLSWVGTQVGTQPQTERRVSLAPRTLKLFSLDRALLC